MIKRSIDEAAKGWLVGPWNSGVAVAVGYANGGIDDPHSHHTMYELYMVARGHCTAVVGGLTVALAAGDLLVVEPGESHTFSAASQDYLHFVVQAPFSAGDKEPTPS